MICNVSLKVSEHVCTRYKRFLIKLKALKASIPHWTYVILKLDTNALVPSRHISIRPKWKSHRSKVIWDIFSRNKRVTNRFRVLYPNTSAGQRLYTIYPPSHPPPPMAGLSSPVPFSTPWEHTVKQSIKHIPIEKWHDLSLLMALNSFLLDSCKVKCLA